MVSCLKWSQNRATTLCVGLTIHPLKLATHLSLSFAWDVNRLITKAVAFGMADTYGQGL